MSNSDYVRQLLGSLDLLAISEHWLFNYDLHKLSSFHCDFSVYASSSPIIEDNFICSPRNIRGNGGVALFIRKSFTQFVKRLPDFCNERVVTVSVSLSARPLCIIAAYIPARSGCTDPFKESLDFLNGIFLQLSVSHDVIILGDMNADLGVAGGPRASTSVNEQGKILLRYLGRWDFLSVHLHVGPSHSSHTYCSEAHGTLSSIDHILCSRHLLSSFSSCFVADDAPLNLSDHFPVCCSFSTFLPKSGFPAVGQSPITTHSRPNWTKAKLFSDPLALYSELVESRLQGILSDAPDISALVEAPSLLESLLGTVSSSLTSVAEEVLPLKRAYKHLRPAWNDQLKLAHSNSKNLYREWVAAGRPREESHPIKVAYKQAKSTFRASLRQHQRELRDARLLELDASDPSRLFAHIRRLNGVNLSPSRLLVVDGVSYEGAQIIEAWAIYFQDLSTPKDLGYDNVFALEVLEQYESLCSLSLADFVDFSDDEVLEAIQSLKPKKSPGSDSVEPEHILFGGESLVSLL